MLACSQKFPALTWIPFARSKKRSLCSLVCKWTYRGQSDENGKKGWDQSYFEQIGLEDLCNTINDKEKYEKIGSEVINPGEIIGELNEKSAKELGLQIFNDGQDKVKVACGLIDAHAGALGLFATQDIVKIYFFWFKELKNFIIHIFSPSVGLSRSAWISSLFPTVILSMKSIIYQRKW